MAIPFKISLFTVNCALLIFLIFQLASSFRNKNKLMSWSTWFYVLCFLWTVFRIIFWSLSIFSDAPWSALTFYLLYWFPSPIQFANFSLLVLFYIQVLSGRDWRTRWRYIAMPLYFLVTLAMTCFTVIWAFLSYNQLVNAESMVDQYYVKVANQSVQRLYSAISFGTLGFLFGYFGYLMSQLEIWQQRRMLITNPRTLGILNSFLCGLFVSRSIYDLGSGLQWWLVPLIQLTSDKDVTVYDFFVNVFWEVFPTLLLLLMITSKSGGVGAHSRRLSLTGTTRLPNYGLFEVINSHRTSAAEGTTGYNQKDSLGYRSGRANPDQPRWTHGGGLFDDPLRYDSDDGGGPSSPPYSQEKGQDYSPQAALLSRSTIGSSGSSYEPRRAFVFEPKTSYTPL